jgi:hypothetical protein
MKTKIKHRVPFDFAQDGAVDPPALGMTDDIGYRAQAFRVENQAAKLLARKATISD